MPTLSESLAVLGDHIGLGAIAALLFVAGLGTAVPVVSSGVRWLMVVPLWLFRWVLRLIGPSFPPLRTFLVIFGFNAVAIFLYMVSGALIVLPAAVAFLTGMNIGVAVLKAGEVAPQMAALPADAAEAGEPPGGGLWVGVCSLAVLLLELPSFWLSVGMGIGLGRGLSHSYTLANLRTLLAPRAAAYASLIIPALLISALAETAAIRGHMRALPVGPPHDLAPGAPGDRASGHDEPDSDASEHDA